MRRGVGETVSADPSSETPAGLRETAAQRGKHRRLLSRLQSYDVCARTCAARRWAALRGGVSPSSEQERGTRGCLASPRRAGTSPAGLRLQEGSSLAPRPAEALPVQQA